MVYIYRGPWYICTYKLIAASPNIGESGGHTHPTTSQPHQKHKDDVISLLNSNADALPLKDYTPTLYIDHNPVRGPPHKEPFLLSSLYIPHSSKECTPCLLPAHTQPASITNNYTPSRSIIIEQVLWLTYVPP